MAHDYAIIMQILEKNMSEGQHEIKPRPPPPRSKSQTTVVSKGKLYSRNEFVDNKMNIYLTSYDFLINIYDLNDICKYHIFIIGWCLEVPSVKIKGSNQHERNKKTLYFNVSCFGLDFAKKKLFRSVWILFYQRS